MSARSEGASVFNGRKTKRKRSQQRERTPVPVFCYTPFSFFFLLLCFSGECLSSTLLGPVWKARNKTKVAPRSVFYASPFGGVWDNKSVTKTKTRSYGWVGVLNAAIFFWRRRGVGRCAACDGVVVRRKVREREGGRRASKVADGHQMRF